MTYIWRLHVQRAAPRPSTAPVTPWMVAHALESSEVQPAARFLLPTLDQPFLDLPRSDPTSAALSEGLRSLESPLTPARRKNNHDKPPPLPPSSSPPSLALAPVFHFPSSLSTSLLALPMLSYAVISHTSPLLCSCRSSRLLYQRSSLPHEPSLRCSPSLTRHYLSPRIVRRSTLALH